MTRLQRTHTEHPAPPPQKKRPALDISTYPPRRLSTIRLERIGTDAVEVWIDSSSEPYLLANLTQRTLGPYVICGDWWDLSSSNAAFIWWVQQHNGTTVVSRPDVLKVLAENFLVYLRNLKQLQEVVV